MQVIGLVLNFTCWELLKGSECQILAVKVGVMIF